MPEIKTPSSIKILRPEIEKAWRKWMEMEVPDFPETFFEEDRPMRKIRQLIWELILLLPTFIARIFKVHWRKILTAIPITVAFILVINGSGIATAILIFIIAIMTHNDDDEKNRLARRIKRLENQHSIDRKNLKNLRNTL